MLVEVLIAVAPATPDQTPSVLGPRVAFIAAMHETDPATGNAWAPAAVDALEAGIEVTP